MVNQPAIHFAVTSHGLGHLTRTLPVIRAVHEQNPGLSIFVSTTIDRGWMKSQLGFDFHYRHQAYEPGALQRDCFTVDVAASVAAYKEFRDRYSEILEKEILFLRSYSFIAVVSDIPALPVAAASYLGLPAIGVSNFTWDWIIEPWCTADESYLVDELRANYASGTRQLCLPFGPEQSSFPEWERAPLVARRANRTRQEVRRMLELSDGPVAVVCPGGWAADEWPAIDARPGRFELVTINDLPVTSKTRCLSLGQALPSGLTMPDLIAASDVVLGKPGYGLASECLTHKIPFAMIDRPNFRETPCLVSQMQEQGRCTTMSLDKFFSGDWESALEEALVDGSEWRELEPEPERTVASRILTIARSEES